MAKRKTAKATSTDVVEAPAPQAAKLAPWPHIDRYPTVLGSNLSLSNITNAFRVAQTGYRQLYVDVLNELLEREPHGFAVLSQRILTVAGGRVEITPAECPESDQATAEEIADACNRMVHAIPDLAQSLAALLWAIYHGVTAQEISWGKGQYWHPTRLHFIHTRRLAYPDQFSWNLHIWDQGMVMPPTWGGRYPTEAMFGLSITDYPGKFIVHTPQLRGEYPTREGLGRELAYWFAIKSIASKGAPAYLERFAKPWPIGYYATSDKEGEHRPADDDDIAVLDAALAALGTGTMNGATLPDSVKVALEGNGGKGRPVLTYAEWITICNAEISKVVLSQTFTTESGKFGSRSTADTGEQAQLRNATYDATALAQTLRRDLVSWIVRLNWPDKMHLVPEVAIHIEDEPDAMTRLELAVKAANVGMPVDADAMADELGLPLVPKPKGEEDKPRRLVPLALMKPADVQALEDPEKLAEQQEQAAQAKQAMGQALQQQKTNGTANGVNGVAKPAPKEAADAAE